MKENINKIIGLFNELDIPIKFTEEMEDCLDESNYFESQYNNGLNSQSIISNDIENLIEEINNYFEDNNIDMYIEWDLEEYDDELKKRLLNL